MDNWQTIRDLKGHTKEVINLLSLPNRALASCSNDKIIRIWEDKSKSETSKILTGHADSIKCLALLANGTLASASSDKTVKIWLH